MHSLLPLCPTANHLSFQAAELSPSPMRVVIPFLWQGKGRASPEVASPPGKVAAAWFRRGLAAFKTTGQLPVVLFSFCFHPPAPFVTTFCSNRSSGRSVTAQKESAGRQLISTRREKGRKKKTTKHKTVNLSIRKCYKPWHALLTAFGTKNPGENSSNKA